MRETGIVRRIDELGRVVIPKEIRKTLRIKEGDPLEIFTENEKLLLKKYSPVSKIDDIAKSVAESLYSLTEMSAAVSDTDRILAAKGYRSKEIADKELSKDVVRIIEARSVECFSGNGEAAFLTKDGDHYRNEVIVPVVSQGDIIGAVILGDDKTAYIEEVAVKMAMLAAEFLARQFY